MEYENKTNNTFTKQDLPFKNSVESNSDYQGWSFYDGNNSMSNSSASGSTITVAAEVCTLPCVSV